MAQGRAGLKDFVDAMVPNVGVSIRRFAVAVLVAATLTLFHVFELDDEIGLTGHETVRLTFALISAFLWSLGAALLAERLGSRGKRIALVSVGLLVIAGLHAFSDAVVFQPYVFAVALGIFVGLAAYPGREGGGALAAFWQFNHRLWLGAGLALLGAVLFAGGLSIITETLELLFELDFPTKTHAKIWIAGLGFVAPVNWLSLVPRDLDERVPEGEQGEFTSRAVATIVKYILVPLLLVYTAILYAYAVKIAVDGVLPKGRLGPMVLAYGAIGTLTILFAYPTRASGGPLVAFFWRHWFWLTIGPVGLLFLAVYARIAQYGVTEERYLVLLAGLWLGALSLAFTLWRRDRDIRLLPLTLMGLLLMASIGPWGTVGLSLRSQTGELMGLLEQTGRLVEGRIVPPGTDDRMATAEAQRVRSLVYYLERHRALDRMVPWFEGVEGNPFERNLDGNKLARAILVLLGVTRPALPDPGGGTERVSCTADRPGAVAIAGFAHMAGPYRVLLGEHRAEKSFSIAVGEQGSFEMAVGQKLFVLVRPSDGVRLTLETADLVARTLGDGGNHRIGPPQILTHDLGATPVGIMFQRFTARKDADKVHELDAVLWLFVGEAPARNSE